MATCTAKKTGWHRTDSGRYNCPVCGAGERKANAYLEALPPAPEGHRRRVIGANDSTHTPNVEYLDEDGLPHREDGPAEVLLGMDGEVEEETWFRHGQMHRDGDQPAYTTFHDDGTVRTEEFYVDGLMHREGGKPSRTRRDENGNIEAQDYKEHGNYHRIDGPAQLWKISADPTGTLQEAWWWRGQPMTDTRRRAPEFGIARDNDQAIEAIDEILGGLPEGEPTQQQAREIELAKVMFPNP